VTGMRGERNMYSLLVRKSQRKRSLGRPSGKWVGNIKINPAEI
jgi:hypothetical protein